MNLLEFAVQRKLDHEDQLLDYVAKKQDVPVDVLSTSLSELIGPLEDRRASLLVKDYAEMLSEYVPMTYKRDTQSGEYTVEGEIDESTLDSISLVHDIDAESAISEMIEENIRVLTNTTAEVQGLDMDELEQVATRLETQTIQTMSDDVEEVDGQEEVAVEDIQEAVADIDEELFEDVAEELNIPDEVPEPVVEPEPEPVVEPEPEPVYEEVPEPVVEPEPEPAQEETQEELPEEEALSEENLNDMLEDVSEEIPEDIPDEEPEMTEEEEQEMIAEKMKRIYTRLVADIKELGLDKSLGLAL